MSRINKKSEPTPEHSVSRSKFGWCSDEYHEDCRDKFFDPFTNKNYECTCDCHTTLDKIQEEQ